MANITIYLQCDQGWAKQLNPEPNLPSQTHLVKSRIDSDYQANNKEFKIISNKYVSLKLNNVTIEGLFKEDNVVEANNLVLKGEFYEYSDILKKKIGDISISIVKQMDSLYMIFNGEFEVSNPYLKGILYDYGDTSYDKNSIGKSILLNNNQSNIRYNRNYLIYCIVKYK